MNIKKFAFSALVVCSVGLRGSEQPDSSAIEIPTGNQRLSSLEPALEAIGKKMPPSRPGAPSTSSVLEEVPAAVTQKLPRQVQEHLQSSGLSPDEAAQHIPHRMDPHINKLVIETGEHRHEHKHEDHIYAGKKPFTLPWVAETCAESAIVTPVQIVAGRLTHGACDWVVTSWKNFRKTKAQKTQEQQLHLKQVLAFEIHKQHAGIAELKTTIGALEVSIESANCNPEMMDQLKQQLKQLHTLLLVQTDRIAHLTAMSLAAEGQLQGADLPLQANE